MKNDVNNYDINNDYLYFLYKLINRVRMYDIVLYGYKNSLAIYAKPDTLIK